MRYLLICQHCGQKHFTNDGSGLVEVKTAPVLKPNNEVADLPKKYKCYNCGFLFKITKLNEEKPVKLAEEELTDLDPESYFKKWENESIKSVRHGNNNYLRH